MTEVPFSERQPPIQRPIFAPFTSETTQTRILVALLDLSEAMNRTKESLERIESKLSSFEQRLSQLQSLGSLEQTPSTPPQFTWYSGRQYIYYPPPKRTVISDQLDYIYRNYFFQGSLSERLVRDVGRIAIYSKVGVPLARLGFVGSSIAAVVIPLLTGLAFLSVPFLVATGFCLYSYSFFLKELKPLSLPKERRQSVVKSPTRSELGLSRLEKESAHR